MDNNENRENQELDLISAEAMWGKNSADGSNDRAAAPAGRRRPVSEEGEIDVRPVRRRRLAEAGEESQEERPVRRRRPAEESGEGQEERPMRRRPSDVQEADELDVPPMRRRRPVEESGMTEERPMRRRRPVEESETAEERPVRRRRPVEESGESQEERPMRRRRPAEESAEGQEERPMRRRRPVEESAESQEERPMRRRRPVEESTESQEERPMRRRPVEERAEGQEERPMRRRRPVEEREESQEERPMRRRRPVEERAEDQEEQTAFSGSVSDETSEVRPMRRRGEEEAAASRIPEDREERRAAREQERENRRRAAKEEENSAFDEMDDEEEGSGTKKKKGLLVFLSVLLIALIALLAVFIWQLKVVQDGGDSFFNSILNQFAVGSSPTLPDYNDPANPVDNKTTTAAEEASSPAISEIVTTESSTEAVKETEPSATEDPNVAHSIGMQTYENDANGNLIIPARQEGYMQTAPAWESILEATNDKILDEANYLAAMYDYDAAIALVKGVSGYESNQAYVDAIASYEQKKSEAVVYDSNSTIPHIFFHSLVVDTSRAFNESIAISPEDGTVKVNAYNYVMTTIEEFCRILEEMYDRGYVLVSIYDIAAYETAADGTQVMKHQPIYLPEGKKPFILSVDDVSYYQYMMGKQGFPTKLVVGEDGTVVNEYIMDDDSVVYGSYDVMPILDDFVEAHPDFSYRGAKGIIALTGYNGIFGYRTSDYWYNWNCEYFEERHAETRARLYTHNDNIEQDKEAARQVAEALKADGWLFASHTWGHKLVGDTNSYETVQWDTMMWEREVEPLIGDTDIIIFPQGEDLYAGSWRGYDPANAKYQLLKSVGFDYFCNVDSNLGWTQLGSDYFRMGRANLDGSRMWEALMHYQDPTNENYKDRLSSLFDSREVFDWSRPTPVVK